MLISTAVRAGTRYSPSCQGSVTRRAITGITGRDRITSWMVAST